MAESNVFLLQQNQTSPNSHQTHFQELTTDTFIMERGPKYNQYSALRNKRLKTKISNPEKEPFRYSSFSTPPLKKQLRSESSNYSTHPKRPKPHSVLTQSVPDFSSVLRKENRKPKAITPRISGKCVTPPTGLLKSGGITSLEKRNSGTMGRKSFASVAELKRLGFDAENASKGGKVTRGICKSVLGNIQ